MLYTILGILSNIFIVLNLVGIWIQLRTIYRRKEFFRVGGEGGGKATAILSLNHYVVRFVAFYVIVIYGYSIRPFNHFLVWLNLGAVLLLYTIVVEIFIDRRDFISKYIFALSTLFLLLGFVMWGLGDPVISYTRGFAEFVIPFLALLIAQSDLHQVYVMRRSGDAGAGAIRTHQTTVIKDISVVSFGLVMGVATGWPVIISAGTSGITKSLILWHFRWVRTSPVAAERRGSQNQIQNSK
ncbi:MAG: hypothetical protein KDD67_05640 [Ignavibacteriae bacterium]|nr:hypothetical protein [Ignavibacteriota bacterium]MCB9214241.1 hypothetical protein [Ignavibacteria bacterium]